MQNIDPFPLSGGMPNAPVLFTVTCSNSSSIKNESDFLLSFIIHSRFFVPPRLSYKQLLKDICQPYRICYRKAYVTAAGFKSLI